MDEVRSGSVYRGWKVTWHAARPGDPWRAEKAGVRLTARTSTALVAQVEEQESSRKDVAKNGVRPK